MGVANLLQKIIVLSLCAVHYSCCFPNHHYSDWIYSSDQALIYICALHNNRTYLSAGLAGLTL